MPPSLLFQSTGAPVPLGSRIGGGGEGDVFSVRGRDLVVKVHRSPTRDLEEKLRAMLATPPKPAGVLPQGYVYAWPTDLVLRAGRTRKVVGFSMTKVPFRYTLAQVCRPSSRGPEVDERFLIRTGRNLSL